ncbi:MAG: hypothetical protein WA990_06635 [Rubrobacteraceae bacterium]
MTDRQGFIERVLHGIEERVEEWREESRARQAEVESNRENLWTEAVEREKMLKETVNRGEMQERSLEEVTKDQRVVFVLHSEESGRALQEFAGDSLRLVNVVSGHSGNREAGIRGSSWLVFEKAD